jgi:acyl dehydratase
MTTESRKNPSPQTRNPCAIELAGLPGLLPLYARAVLGRHHGDGLPPTSVVLREQAIDPEHLVAYQRTCGFRVRDVLPPTYLHLLAFPLAVTLMVEPAFPFPVVGLLHLANVIEQHRTVRMDEVVSIGAHAADLRAHHAGRTVDLITEATVGDETVWRERSTYLRREKRSGPRPPRVATNPPYGPVIRIRVPADIGRRYAALSGDRNPIHLHPLAARVFGFQRAIAHGMWLEARALAAIEARLPQAFTVDVTFKAPVPLPSTLSLVATRDGDAWLLDVRGTGSGKPHMTGSVTPGS